MIVNCIKNIFPGFLIVIILSLPYASIAQITPNANGIVFVNKSVTGGNQSGNSWANAVPELADALLSAHSNNSIQQIWVAKGTYAPKYSAGTDGISPWLQFGVPDCGHFGSFVVVNNVKLYGGFQNANETSITQRDTINNNTILSGLDSFVHVVMSVGNVGAAQLNGFTIKGGKSYPFQTLYVNGQATRAAFGGGIYMLNTNLVINNCTISENTANAGGGIYAENSGLTLKRTALVNNSAIASDGTVAQSSSAAFGGGVYFLNGTGLTVDSCEFNNNSAISIRLHTMGGGLSISQTSSAPVNISNTNFTDNKAYLNVASGATPPFTSVLGGGIGIINPYQVSYLNNCVFSDNTVQLSAQNATLSGNTNEVFGGGIFTGSPLSINHSTIKNNKVIANINVTNNPTGLTAGAGIATDGGRVNGSVGGVNTGVNLTINNSIIENNEASGHFNPSGGGISYIIRLYLLPGAVKPKINNSIIRNNTAKFGGGIHCLTLAPVIKNTLLQGNTATEGSAIYNESPGQTANMQLINCTVFGNKSHSNQTPVIANDNSSTTTLHNSIVYNNTGNLSVTSNIAMHSIIEGSSIFPGIGNKNQDPQFINTSSGNFGLLNTSPAANAGSNTLYTAAGNIISNDTDLAGNPRLYENTIDMGAFELQTKAIIDTSTSVRNTDQAKKVKLFPNPGLTGQNIQLQLNQPATYYKGALLVITDVSGKKVWRQELAKADTQIKAPQAPGTYFINIYFKNGDKANATLTIR